MVTPKILAAVYDKMEVFFRNRGLTAGRSGRHMKFPYTFTAKCAQFPYFYYMKHNNIWMYYPLGLAIGFYFFSKIHAVVNSPANVQAWAETQRRNAEKEHH